MDSDLIREQLPGEVPGLLRYAQLLTGRPHDAADLVQDTLERALSRSGSFDGRSSLRTWLHRIMHNLYVDSTRTNRESPTGDLAELVEARWREDHYTVDAAVVAERAADRDDLREALVHLPEIYRTAVVLHDGHGMTVAEVADVAGIGLPAAKQRLRRGRMMLVTGLADETNRTGKGVGMRCWEARAQVSDYLDGALPPRSARSLEAHLSGCQTCPPLYASLVATRHELAEQGRPADPDSVVPPDLAARIAALLDGR